jgi:hypothetical protein
VRLVEFALVLVPGSGSEPPERCEQLS